MTKFNQCPPKKPVNPKWDIPAGARKVVNKYRNNNKDKRKNIPKEDEKSRNRKDISKGKGNGCGSDKNGKHDSTGGTDKHEHTLHNEADRPVGKKTFKCKICDKQFAWKQNLMKHINVTHTVRKFACKQCNKVYSHPQSLQGHV